MVVPPGLAAQQVLGSRLPAEKHMKPLTEQEKVLQALNRFTFGPRPGDVATVEKIGLQRWFEMQLHPGQMDDSAFAAEMAQFPAMGLPADQLKERFPSAGKIRQMSKRGGSVPSDPVERAIYGDAEAVYEVKVENKAAGALVNPTRLQSERTDGTPAMVAGAPAMDAGTPGMLADGGRLREASAQNSVIADGIPEMPYEQVEAVLRLEPEQRLGRLVAMTPEQMLGFREVVKGKDRVRLMAGLAPAQRDGGDAGAGGRYRRRRDAADAGYRLEAAAAGGDDGVLAEPLQCVSAQERAGALYAAGLRAADDFAACPGKV
jgi:hypothetical protein